MGRIYRVEIKLEKGQINYGQLPTLKAGDEVWAKMGDITQKFEIPRYMREVFICPNQAQNGVLLTHNYRSSKKKLEDMGYEVGNLTTAEAAIKLMYIEDQRRTDWEENPLSSLRALTLGNGKQPFKPLIGNLSAFQALAGKMKLPPVEQAGIGRSAEQLLAHFMEDRRAIEKELREAERAQQALDAKAEGKRVLDETIKTEEGCIELLKHIISPELNAQVSEGLKGYLFNNPIKASEVIKKGLKKICKASSEEGAAAAGKTVANIIESHKFEHGQTLLHLAAFHGASDVVESLVTNGIKADAQNELGFTPLMLACMEGRWESAKKLIIIPKGVKELVKISQDLGLVDNDGCNALHHLLKTNTGTAKQIELLDLIVQEANKQTPGLGYVMLFQQQGIVLNAEKTPNKLIEAKPKADQKIFKVSVEKHKAEGLKFIAECRAAAKHVETPATLAAEEDNADTLDSSTAHDGYVVPPTGEDGAAAHH